MSPWPPRPRGIVALLAWALASVVTLGPREAGVAAAPARVAAPAPAFGDDFWAWWGDGRAELAGYDLTLDRYGSARNGVAVTIFVTETFSESARVKADPGRHPATDEFPVLKLNLVRDFPTGIYDYQLMTSGFVALAPRNGRPAGAATKVSFSSQEWCGNLYSQVLFDDASARLTSHSYFDGEGDRASVARVPNDAVSEDVLLAWARGLAAPRLAPGETRRVPMVRSLQRSRLRHVPFAVEPATLTRGAQSERVRVPAGTFDCDVYRVAMADRSWTIHVERARPGRVIQWAGPGESARLLASDRIAYWRANGPEGIALLSRLGLSPRPRRTP